MVWFKFMLTRRVKTKVIDHVRPALFVFSCQLWLQVEDKINFWLGTILCSEKAYWSDIGLFRLCVPVWNNKMSKRFTLNFDLCEQLCQIIRYGHRSKWWRERRVYQNCNESYPKRRKNIMPFAEMQMRRFNKLHNRFLLTRINVWVSSKLGEVCSCWYCCFWSMEVSN